MFNILIVDDEQDIRDIISDTLNDEGYKTIEAHNVKSALEAISSNTFHLVILDIWLEGHYMDGIGLLRTIKRKYPCIPIIMISGHANTELAIQTIKLGAYDFIEKPFKTEKLLILVKRAIEAKQLANLNELLIEDTREMSIIGTSKAVTNLRNQLSTIANSNSRIIICGDIGVGKGFVAKIIHYNSKRVDRPFIHYRTANKSIEQVHTELFGDEQSKNSVLEIVNGGTLFIDEIANLAAITQEKLLDVVQNNILRKNSKVIELNIRFITSTSYDVKKLVEDGLFNKTLLLRLETTRLNIPPLSSRKQDIPYLAQYFCKKLVADFATKELSISDNAYSIMMSYNWPGNIRELHNVMERLIIIAQKQNLCEIDSRLISDELFGNKILSVDKENNFNNMIIEKNYKNAKDSFERYYIITQLKKFNHNVTRTADFIGMDRAALHRKMKILNIDSKERTHEF